MDSNLHNFIFNPGAWMGEGRILLNMVEEELSFLTNWNILGKDFAGKVQCLQEIQINGISENMKNDIYFYDFGPRTFCVEMDSPNIGRVVGTGVHDDKVIAWEFRENDMNFEGYETYHLQPDGSYVMQAEYVTTDQFRTLIDGKIWQQKQEKS